MTIEDVKKRSEREGSTRLHTNRRMDSGVSTQGIQVDRHGRPKSTTYNKQGGQTDDRKLISAQGGDRYKSQIDEEIEQETQGYMGKDNFSEKERQLLAMFQEIDDDNSGYIDWHELRGFLNGMAEVMGTPPPNSI